MNYFIYPEDYDYFQCKSTIFFLIIQIYINYFLIFLRGV